ncbi:MAG: ComF family protein [Pedobacter sp.]|nr:ComF family protein [Pedobacter sp.]
MHLLNRLFQDFIGLLYPNLCSGCSKPIYYGESMICTSCLFEIPYTDDHLNPDNRVAKQFWARIQFDGAMALLHFKKGNRVQSMLHQLKYKGKTELGQLLGKMIGDKLLLSTQFKEIDLIIPVPMHRKKLYQRGYNQSLCITEGIAQVLGCPVNDKALLKVKETATQTHKGRLSRNENMTRVFEVFQLAELQGKHILLVDDVITTGATIEACGIELWKAGIGNLSIAAVAFAD